jgi:hypothetical protein
MPGSICLPGEEVVAVFLMYRGKEYCLRLSLAMRILFDYLARHSRLPQSARQIEVGIRADDFYKDHSKNANRCKALTRKITRSAVRVYITRVHEALALAFQDAKVNIEPKSVLIEMETTGTEVLYQLKCTSAWRHIDLTSRDAQPLRGEKARLFGR